MSDDWKTPGQPRLIGHMNDASGNSVAFKVDRGAVIIRRGGQDIRLSAGERDPFVRLFMQSEREADAWLAEREEEESRAETDCQCSAASGERCPCEADGPDGLCSCCRGVEGEHRGICAAPGGADVVTAEIWCAVRACVNGPADHLWTDSCRDGYKAPGPAT